MSLFEYCSIALSQPGFVSGSKFLLPWDVPVREPDWDHIKANWPNLAEIAMKRPNFQPRGKSEHIRRRYSLQFPMQL